MHFTTRTVNSCSRNEPQCARLTSEEGKSSPEDSTTNRLQTTSSIRRQRITHQPENTSRDLRGRLLVALVDGDVLVQLGNLLRQGSRVGLGLLDGRNQLLHLRRRLGQTRSQMRARTSPYSYGKLAGARSRRYRSRFLEVNAQFSSVVKLYKICKRLTSGVQSGNHEKRLFKASPGRKTMHRRRDSQTAPTQRGLEEGEEKFTKYRFKLNFAFCWTVSQYCRERSGFFKMLRTIFRGDVHRILSELRELPDHRRRSVDFF